MKNKKKYLLSLVIALLFGFGLFFISNNRIDAEEVTTEDTVTEVEENKEETNTEEKEDEENIYDKYYSIDDIKKLDDYEVTVKPYVNKVLRELSKFKELSFEKVFGNYNSFYEAVDMSKSTVIKVIIFIVVLSVLIYVFMKIFKITKK